MRFHNPGTRNRKVKNDLRTEFRLHRCLFHHYDIIDFVVFEFGMRLTYLVSRVLCMILLPLLVASMYDLYLAYDHGATPHSGLIYMHMWLSWLLIVSVAVDVAALTHSAVKYPTCELVCLRSVPWYFKVMWFLYNTVYPNILSCAVMYMFLKMKSKIGYQYYYFMLMAVYACIHCSSTAIPSRIGHFLQPLLLNVFHVFFTAVYQYAGGTDPTGANYVYLAMDWSFKLDALLVAILWFMATTVCHMLLVFGSWARRQMYRRLRKGKEAFMNLDPDDDSSLCSVDQDGDYNYDQPSPRIWIEDIPGDPSGHKRVILETSPARKKRFNDPPLVFHEVYRNPAYPGERRKRLVLEPPAPAHDYPRYCFAPAEPCGCPPPYYSARDADKGAGKKKTFICHPETSPDGKSMVFTCMPQDRRDVAQQDCYACDEERADHRYDVHRSATVPPPGNKLPAHGFVVFPGHGPIQTKTLVCPRDEYLDKLRSVNTSPIRDRRAIGSPGPLRESESKASCLSCKKKKKKPKKVNSDEVVDAAATEKANP